ncbi:ribosylnicotinamide kinase [Pseudogymnoascus verrucosus]|uniref:Ribosylnicotinamide kinase n=1 Tax=Pseudogymnoascus verrucosus TaxID=342668 RepID=A0A1B8GG40_9PEZI|nr:ribosylnicotinamide kinase [Pseudogymnoascus verrucosus]OBT94797.2 ribosylnicotinamide kinase [Pseudogymnoascus verrucosus]
MRITERKAVVVGLSGASSSGKTTLARLLRDIFPNSFILHEDDFYREEKELPTKNGLLDWDCAEALSIPDIKSSLSHIQDHGTFPPQFDSKEDRNDVGQCPVSDAAIAGLKGRVAAWTQPGRPGHGILTSSESALRLCIFDGFLLYAPSMAEIQPHIDIKLFLRVGYEKAKARREARTGYATIEGWWADPPGYVDKIVWPNYVEDHAWMFEDGNVEGKFKEDVLKERGIHAQSQQGPDVDMETTLVWTVDVIMKSLEISSGNEKL